MSETLPKSERLSGVISVSALMREGRWGVCGSLRYCFRSSGEEGHRVMVSVPKKYFKRAVKRNLLKRRLRESYRTQKDILDGRQGTDVLLVYNSREVLPYADIREMVGNILRLIAERQK